MKDALGAIVANLPSESGGPTGRNRTRYQDAWTLCLVLELHLKEDNYLVVCDYHDDVVVVEGEGPGTIRFYQVKTSAKSRWTLKKLLNQPKGAGERPSPSILGRLLGHRLVFRDLVGNLTFVSNEGFSVPCRTGLGSDGDIALSDLGVGELQDLRQRLFQELGEDVVDDASRVYLVVSDLALKDFEGHARLQLEKFLSERHPDRTMFPLAPMFRTLLDEVVRRAASEEPCTTIVDLKTRKAITRAYFESAVTSCLAIADAEHPNSVESALRDALLAEGMATFRRLRILSAAGRYRLERMDRTRTDLLSLAKAATDWAVVLLSTHEAFIPLVEVCIERARKSRAWSALTDDYVFAIIAWEILLHVRRLSSAGTQHEKETP